MNCESSNFGNPSTTWYKMKTGNVTRESSQNPSSNKLRVWVLRVFGGYDIHIYCL